MIVDPTQDPAGHFPRFQVSKDMEVEHILYGYVYVGCFSRCQVCRTSQPTTTEVEPSDGELCRTGAKGAGLARSDERLGVPAANPLRLPQLPLRATGRCPPLGHGPELDTRWAQPPAALRPPRPARLAGEKKK